MRQRLAALPVCLALCGAVMALPAAPAHADVRDLLPFGRTYRISKVLPAVVNVTMARISNEPADPTDTSAPAGPRRIEAIGSGFIIDPSGIIVTNRHVVADAIEVTVTLQGGRTLPAKILSIASNTDLALIKIESDKPLPVLKWADSDRLHIGDQVLAIGNPLGVGESVSSGIISGLNRNIKISPFDSFIQTDAAINHGNSGGPLVNMRGEVVGVDTALFTPTDAGGSVGIGFAIPANEAQFVIDQLRKFGRSRFGWLGIGIQDMNPDIADSLGLTPPRGAILANVDPDGPAAKAGLQEGDVILSFAGQEPKDGRALARSIEHARIGVAVDVPVWRDGKPITIAVTPGEWVDKSAAAATAKPTEAVRPPSTDPQELGLQLAALTDDARSKNDLAADQTGVLVAKVAPDSTAADRAFAAGDVILKVQQQPVATAEDVHQRMVEALDQHHHHTRVLIRRNGAQRWISVPIGP